MSNSTEMVERVARALNPAIFAREGGHGEGECPYCDDERKEARRLARAAIEAMREPTPAMGNALCAYIDPLSGNGVREGWSAAISAALSPEDEGRERK